MLLTHDSLDGFDHHDGVVDHNTDGQHHREQCQLIYREAHDLQPHERAQQCDRHHERRDERRAEALQEHEHHDEHQRNGLEQRDDHFPDRDVDEGRGIERHEPRDACRKGVLQRRHLGFDGVDDLQRVGAR